MATDWNALMTEPLKKMVPTNSEEPLTNAEWLELMKGAGASYKEGFGK